MSTVGAIEKLVKVGFLCISHNPDNTINKMYWGWMKFLFHLKQTQICQQKQKQNKKKNVDLLSFPISKISILGRTEFPPSTKISWAGAFQIPFFSQACSFGVTLRGKLRNLP